MHHFVLTKVITYYFTAPSWFKAVQLAALPSAIEPVNSQIEQTLTCEETGEEEILP